MKLVLNYVYIFGIILILQSLSYIFLGARKLFTLYVVFMLNIFITSLIFGFIVNSYLLNIGKIEFTLVHLTVFTIYIEIRSLLNRGFSLNILRTILLYENSTLTIKQISNFYGNGENLHSKYQKRLNQLVSLRLLFPKNKSLSLTRLGSFVSSLLKFISQIIFGLKI
jgi:hypothetical protein